MKKFFREPLVHFLLMGAALFVAFSWWGKRGGNQTERFVVTAGQLESLAAGFSRVWQRPPSEQELNGLIEDHVREELFYREALSLGLDRDDSIIRRRLNMKLEMAGEDVISQAGLTDEQLREFMLERQDAYRIEPQVSFRQIFFNPEKRGERAEADAKKVLAQLAGQASSTNNPGELGDPSVLPQELPLSGLSLAARQFGDEFAQQLLQVEPGRWTGPIKSRAGFHLVLVRERKPGRLPELAEVRKAVEFEWRTAHRKEQADALYRKLRERYTIVIERPGATNAIPPATAEVKR